MENKFSIKVENLYKSYGSKVALDNLSFNVEKGELFGFIGPDGAGKTTLFRILASLLIPDKGKAILEDFNVVDDFKKIRHIVGYMPGRFSLYQDLSVEENLEFFATIFGTSISENYELIKDIYIQIEPFKKRLAGKLSGGMKQKLALSCAMIHKPKVLILDEPTTGVDAVSRKEFWEMLKKLKLSGITIIVSTPYMDEATLCDRVALIQQGEILTIDKPENIKLGYTKKIYALRTDNLYKLLTDIIKYEFTHTIYPFGQYLHYSDKRDNCNLNELNNYISINNHNNIEIKEIVASIEDCFMEYMTEKQ